MFGKAGGYAVKRWALFGIAALLTLCVCRPAHCQMDELRRQEATAFFQDLFTRSKAVGGGVIIAQGGERMYSFFYGAANKSGSQKVDENTVYKVASLSKLISAMGVMRLYDEGRLNLDAPLTSASGSPIANPRYPDIPVTLRQAMSHTSSLLPGAPYAGSPKWDALTENDETYFSRYAPGAHYAYANLNGGILCSVVEQTTGQSFNTYMAENIFQPLGINAAYAAHLLPDPTALSCSFYTNGELYITANKYVNGDRETYDDTCDPARHYRASIGGLYISLSGLEKLGNVLSCGGKADGVRLLSLGAARVMRLDQASLPGSTVAGESPYGLCMYRLQLADGSRWYGHQGRWEGMLADLFVEPDSQTTVVFVMSGVHRSDSELEIDGKMERVLNHISPWIQETSAGFVVEDEE